MRTGLHIVIAPDSFKETLPAAEVAAAIAAGVADVVPSAQIDCCPMADGGDGTMAAMVAATGGEIRTVDVFDALRQKRTVEIGVIGDVPQRALAGGTPKYPWGCSSVDPTKNRGQSLIFANGNNAKISDSPPANDNSAEISDSPLAIIEMARAAGLALVPPEKRNPLLTTTFGVGQMILAALDAGAARLVIGIGGSATTDGGAGCAQALGVTFIRKNGQVAVCGLAGGDLADIGRIDIADRDPRIASADIRVACDVTNPLTGPTGSAAVYGPQKGATPEMVAQLDAGLANLAEVIRRDLGMDVEHIPGAGAAGGLGAGLVAFAGAKLIRGVTIVAEAVGLESRLRGADLVITGEGRFDSQSANGKTAVGVAEVAAKVGVPAICIPGQAAPDAPHHLFRLVRPLVGADVTVAQAMAEPARILRQRAAEVMTQFS